MTLNIKSADRKRTNESAVVSTDTEDSTEVSPDLLGQMLVMLDEDVVFKKSKRTTWAGHILEWYKNLGNFRIFPMFYMFST